MSEREIFLAVLDLPATARTEYLDKACGADASLRNRVDALLNSHEGAGSFLGTPAVAPPDPESATTRTFGSEGGTGTDDEVSLGFLESPTRSDSLGRIGHYEVLQVLGQGGFGIVFRAFDEVLHRVVAVKVLSPQMAATSPARKRFLREARSSAQVRHENVVHVYEVAEQPLPYLVMEFIPGETLQEKLNRVGPLDVPETLRIGRQIAEGLAAAHATDLIHRDIKPGNILLEGGQHKVKITDFGLARAADDASISQSGIIAGTPMYMAPEQAQGQTLDQRADLFSLGSVLYQMVAGRSPFRANNTVAVLKRVAEDTPRAIREIIPETPQWLCDIIAKLHAKDPDDRYQSAREVADVLADCEAQLKANAKLKDYSRIPRSKPLRSGRRRWVAAAEVVLLLGIGIAATEYAGVTHLFHGLPMEVADQPGPVTEDAGNLGSTSGGAANATFAIDSPYWRDGDRAIVCLMGQTPGKPLQPAVVLLLKLPSQSMPSNCNVGLDAEKYYWDVRFSTAGKQQYDIKYEIDYKAVAEKLVFGEHPYSLKGARIFLVDLTAQLVHVTCVMGEVTNLVAEGKTGREELKRAMENLRREHQAIDEFWGGQKPFDSTAAPVGKPPLAVAPFDAAQARAHQEAWAKYLGRPVVYTDSIGMKLPIIPPGKFMMGSSQEEIDFWLKQNEAFFGDHVLREGPQHEVEVTQPFYMGQTDVTVGQFRQFVKATGYKTQAEREGGSLRGFANAEFKVVADTNWLNPGFDQTNDHPVVCVSWNDAVEFCKWLSKQEGKTYRLPTEAEWEYSCRAGSTGRWCFGDNEGELWNYARVNSQTHSWPVAGLKENAWGLYDMHGNVSEWCQDVHDPNYYKTSPPKDPPGPATGEVCAIRGGMWLMHDAYNSRSAMRYYHSPAGSGNFHGFRVVLVVSPAAGVGTESGVKDKPAPAAIAPFTDADVRRIAALPAGEQIEEVRKELMHRNPGFDGKMEHKIEGGVVTEFQIVSDKVTDIAPIRVFAALRVFDCRGTWINFKPNGLLADLRPLEEMNLAALTYLNLSNTNVGDAGLANFKDCKNLVNLYLGYAKVSDAGLANFKDCKKLTNLWLDGTQVGDEGMVHFQGCKALTRLSLAGTKVSDVGLAHFKDCKNLKSLWLDRTPVGNAGLAQFKGVPLRVLSMDSTRITDLTPLQGMPLEDIRLTPKNITKGLDILRGMTSLKTIGIDWNQSWPAAEFWERYEKGEFK